MREYQTTELPNQETEQTGVEQSIEAAANLILAELDDKSNFTERIPLLRDRSFDLPPNLSEYEAAINIPQIVKSAYKMNRSQLGLYELAKQISQRHQELRFSFKLDDENKWIEYEVKKVHLKIGDEVIWENSGALQWSEPKKITNIQEYPPESNIKFAFFEGPASGVLLNELVLPEDVEPGS